MNQRATIAGAANEPRAAMESLARELDVPVEEIEQVYREESAALEAGARIKQFVPVLAARQVRDELRRRRRVA